MGRYYFDIYNGVGSEIDKIGLDLVSKKEVRRHAATILAEIVRDELPLSSDGSLRVNVRDARREIVFFGEVHFHSLWRNQKE